MQMDENVGTQYVYINIIEQQQVYANIMYECCISRQTKQYTNSR